MSVSKTRFIFKRKEGGDLRRISFFRGGFKDVLLKWKLLSVIDVDQQFDF